MAKKSDIVPEFGQQCDEAWRAWPSMQDSAISEGNVMVFQLFASVGNLFIMLSNAIQVRERKRGEHPRCFESLRPSGFDARSFSITFYRVAGVQSHP